MPILGRMWKAGEVTVGVPNRALSLRFQSRTYSLAEVRQLTLDYLNKPETWSVIPPIPGSQFPSAWAVKTVTSNGQKGEVKLQVYVDRILNTATLVDFRG